jgi:hypothetical protein
MIPVDSVRLLGVPTLALCGLWLTPTKRTFMAGGISETLRVICFREEDHLLVCFAGEQVIPYRLLARHSGYWFDGLCAVWPVPEAARLKPSYPHYTLRVACHV